MEGSGIANQHSTTDDDVDDTVIVQSDSNNNDKKKKRGMKPRSQRNRKRSRFQLGHVACHNEEYLVYPTCVRRLELDGHSLGVKRWLRLIEPYPYTYSTYAKARWEHRTLLDVYTTEFGSYPLSYYKAAIMQGRILVSNQIVDCNYNVKSGDVLSHTVHRHEPAVAVSSPDPPLYGTVVHETETVIIINKPATIPVHPCGGYHVQSLMNILETHYHQRLYTIHRLDRLTSGLVILAKTSTVAQQWSKLIMNRDCQKVYLARVQGRFPYNCPRNLTRLVIRASAAAGFVDVPWYGEWNNNLVLQDDDATITPPPVRTAVDKHLETKKEAP
jgi:23S rRNA-/tRNA-specific pseudouridylate synthase